MCTRQRGNETTVAHIGSLYSGLSGKTATDFGRGEARYVTFLNVIGNVSVDPRQVEPVLVHRSDTQNSVQCHDVLFNQTSETPDDLAMGSVVRDDMPDLYLNSFCFGLRIRDLSEYDPLFLAYFFRSPLGRALVRPLAQGATRYNLSRHQFSHLRLYVPAYQEQRDIVETLIDMDEDVAAIRRQVTKLRAIKTATTQRLLSGATRMPGFFGRWRTKSLGELGQISGAGVDKKSHASEASVRLINYLDVYHKTFLHSTDLTHVVTADPGRAHRCSVRRGDVFFTPTSEVSDDIGHSAVAMEDIPDAVYSYHVVRFRLRHDWDLRFRAYAFQTHAFHAQAGRVSEGSGTRYVITLPQFRELHVRFPPDPREQSAIATVLAEIDAEIDSLRRRLDKTRSTNDAAMDALLRGRARGLDASTPRSRSARGCPSSPNLLDAAEEVNKA